MVPFSAYKADSFCLNGEKERKMTMSNDGEGGVMMGRAVLVMGLVKFLKRDVN
jgi:hypothetical protein